MTDIAFSLNRPADDIAPCVDYVFRLLARTFGLAMVNASASSAGVYGLQYGIDPDATSRSDSRTLRIRRSGFFGAGFGKKPELGIDPATLLEAAEPEGFRRHVTTSTDGAQKLEFDLPAAAFWLLTRYEEQVAPKQDEDGRFLSTHSLLPPEIYNRPLVHLWFRNLVNLLREMGGLQPLPPRESQQTIALTHDLDLMHKFRGVRGLRRLLSTMAGAPGSAVTEAKHALPILLGRNRDPYDSFDDLFMIKGRVSAPSTLFLMGRSGGRDADYSLHSSELRQVLLRSRAMHDELAVHLSWDSRDSATVIHEDAEAVATATAAKPDGSRQHYLRISLPQTFHHLHKEGIRYDSTLGFADRGGFRCGWAGPYPFFDVHARKELPVLEVPLICMDVSLAKYEKIPAELCLERLTNLLDAACDYAPGGAFVFLWHNIMADRRGWPGYWDVFEYFFSIASGSARFVTLKQLCQEYEKRT